MEEIWKDIEGYEGLYQVSNLGRIKSLNYNKQNREQILVPHLPKRGYYVVTLSNGKERKTKKIHRLVAEAFIPNVENKLQVNHIDGNKLNNNVKNLEWCTDSENMIHAYKTGLMKPVIGKQNGTSREVIKYDLNMNEIARYETGRLAAKENNMSKSGIAWRCKVGKPIKGFIWKYKE